MRRIVLLFCSNYYTEDSENFIHFINVHCTLLHITTIINLIMTKATNTNSVVKNFSLSHI